MRTYFDEAEDLANPPEGGRIKQWLAGVMLAAVPIVYGSICIHRGHTTLFGRGGNADLSGEAGTSLAVAYIALGAFLHFHYYWGLSERLSRFSQFAKLLAVAAFLPCFIYALYFNFF